jgi:hypothetical protein
VPALMGSELPEVARARLHWIVMVRPPERWAGIGLLLLLLWAWLDPIMVVVLILVLGAAAFLRWRAWRAELIILTNRRIVRVRGLPETTTTEASLRIDRVTGARLVQTVPGKLLGYATIVIEAPGDHPDARRLARIAEPAEFYDKLRTLAFADRAGPVVDDEGPSRKGDESEDEQDDELRYDDDDNDDDEG